MTSSEARTALTPMWVVVGLAMGPAVALGLARFGTRCYCPPCVQILVGTSQKQAP